MRRAERRGCAQIRLGLGKRLLRQRVHEVEVHVVEVLARDFDRASGLGIVVYASERPQVPGIEALYADGKTVHAG